MSGAATRSTLSPLASAEELVATHAVVPQRIPRRCKENHFQHNERKVQPTDRKESADLSAVAGIRESQTNEHVCIELVVLVVNPDEELKRLDVAAEFREITLWNAQSRSGMKLIDYGPSNGAHGHADAERRDGEI